MNELDSFLIAPTLHPVGEAAIYRLIWEELQASGYLQIDETPVRVLDP